jgi:hypothetical protein
LLNQNFAWTRTSYSQHERIVRDQDADRAIFDDHTTGTHRSALTRSYLDILVLHASDLCA